MATRKLVERAKGILQRDLGLSEEQAFLALQRQSRQKRRPMKEIAEAIVSRRSQKQLKDGVNPPAELHDIEHSEMKHASVAEPLHTLKNSRERAS